MSPNEQSSSNKQRRKLSLSRLIREVPSQEELNLAWDEVDQHSSHRSAAIIGAAFVEDAVRFAISRQFVELTDKEFSRLFDNTGTLSSFNSLIDIGYALGIYKSLVRDDLHVIRRIRNGFAHAMKPINFDTPEIVKEVASFQYMSWRDKQPNPLPFGGPAFDSMYRETFARICRVFVHEIFMAGLTGPPAQVSPAELELLSAASYILPDNGV